MLRQELASLKTQLRSAERERNSLASESEKVSKEAEERVNKLKRINKKAAEDLEDLQVSAGCGVLSTNLWTVQYW